MILTHFDPKGTNDFIHLFQKSGSQVLAARDSHKNIQYQIMNKLNWFLNDSLSFHVSNIAALSDFTF